MQVSLSLPPSLLAHTLFPSLISLFKTSSLTELMVPGSIGASSHLGLGQDSEGVCSKVKMATPNKHVVGINDTPGRKRKETQKLQADPISCTSRLCAFE